MKNIQETAYTVGSFILNVNVIVKMTLNVGINQLMFRHYCLLQGV